jgi:hypothetical protein
MLPLYKKSPKKETHFNLTARFKVFFFNFVAWKLWHNFPNVFQIYTKQKKNQILAYLFLLPSGEIFPERKTLALFPFFSNM